MHPGGLYQRCIGYTGSLYGPPDPGVKGARKKFLSLNPVAPKAQKKILPQTVEREEGRGGGGRGVQRGGGGIPPPPTVNGRSNTSLAFTPSPADACTSAPSLSGPLSEGHAVPIAAPLRNPMLRPCATLPCAPSRSHPAPLRSSALCPKNLYAAPVCAFLVRSFRFRRRVASYEQPSSRSASCSMDCKPFRIGTACLLRSHVPSPTVTPLPGPQGQSSSTTDLHVGCASAGSILRLRRAGVRLRDRGFLRRPLVFVVSPPRPRTVPHPLPFAQCRVCALALLADAFEVYHVFGGFF